MTNEANNENWQNFETPRTFLNNINRRNTSITAKQQNLLQKLYILLGLDHTSMCSCFCIKMTSTFAFISFSWFISSCPSRFNREWQLTRLSNPYIYDKCCKFDLIKYEEWWLLILLWRNGGCWFFCGDHLLPKYIVLNKINDAINV